MSMAAKCCSSLPSNWWCDSDLNHSNVIATYCCTIQRDYLLIGRCSSETGECHVAHRYCLWLWIISFSECKLAFLLKLQWNYIKTSKCESVYLVGAALFLPVAVVLVNYNRASSCIKRYLLEGDPPNIPRSPLENNNHNLWTRYFVLRILFIIYLFLALLLLMMMLYTGTVLILAPFSVPVKLQFRTWTSSTRSVAPFSPILPMLKTHAYRKGHIVNYIQIKVDFFFFFL